MPYAKNYPFHPRPNEKDLPSIPSDIPGEEEFLDVLFAPQKDLISEEEWFRVLKKKWMLDPYGQGLFDYDEKGRNPAGNTTKDTLFEDTGLENFQIRKSQINMEGNMGEKSIGIFKGKEYEIPKEYKLREDVEFGEDIERYLWRPKTGDYIYFPDIDTIVKYEKWAERTPEGGMGGLDGVCFVTIVGGPDEGESEWINNLEARKGIPIEKIASEKKAILDLGDIKTSVQYGDLDDIARSVSPEEVGEIKEKADKLMDIDNEIVEKMGLDDEKYQKLVSSRFPLSDPEVNELRKIYLDYVKEYVTEKVPAVIYLILEDENYHVLNEALVYLDLFEPSIENIPFYHFEEYEPEKLSHKLIGEGKEKIEKSLKKKAQIVTYDYVKELDEELGVEVPYIQENDLLRSLEDEGLKLNVDFVVEHYPGYAYFFLLEEGEEKLVASRKERMKKKAYVYGEEQEKIGKQFEKDVKKLKEKLINKAKKKGLYENFGDEEQRELIEKYYDHIYTNEIVVKALDEFYIWCANVDLDYIKTSALEEKKSRVDEIWEKMNDSEQFGCQFGMFPKWLQDEYDPTHEEIVELMGKGEPNVNASKKLAEKEVLNPTLKTWRKWLQTGKAKAVQQRGFYGGEWGDMLYEIDGTIYKEANPVAPTYSYHLEKYEGEIKHPITSTKKLAQDFDTTKGRPTVEHEEPTQRGEEEKPENEEIGEDFFEEKPTDGEFSFAPGERTPMREKPIQPERNLLKQLTPMDMKEYTSMVDERTRAEAQGDLSKADYMNNAIRELLNKYMERPDTLNETSPSSFVGRMMKAHTMLTKGDYQKVIKSVGERLTKLRRDMKLRISSASVYRIDRESDDKATVDFALDIMTDNFNSKNIMVRAFKEGEKIDIHPYFWDSLGRMYRFDDAGIKRLFNLQRTDAKIIEEFKIEEKSKE